MGTVRPRPDKPGRWWAKCVINGKEIRKTFRSEEEASQELLRLERLKKEQELVVPVRNRSELRNLLADHLAMHGKQVTTLYVLDLIYELAG